MQRTRSQWKDLVPYRLDDIYEAVIRDDCYLVVIRDLRAFEMISEYYDEHCLAVDVWYLFDRRQIYTHRRFAEICVIREPAIRVLFGIVVQALCDVKTGRPCDVRSWRLDHPPGGGLRCSPTTHLCKRNAAEFISEMSEAWEPILNLSDGTLMHLAAKKNGSVRSRSTEIFNCTGQESE